MAESLCSDESFAETRDTADCWNGQTIGEWVDIFPRQVHLKFIRQLMVKLKGIVPVWEVASKSGFSRTSHGFQRNTKFQKEMGNPCAVYLFALCLFLFINVHPINRFPTLNDKNAHFWHVNGTLSEVLIDQESCRVFGLFFLLLLIFYLVVTYVWIITDFSGW